MNVIEIDAASNNGVDNIREIREEVAYSPAEGKYKVYIIDEVHMLSIGAFNALLKTLEEPPSYVIFILATTEAHKIPITILSRCQRYDFRRIPMEVIAGRLTELLEAEQVTAEEKAVRYLAKAGDGSLRDAISLLDRCIAFYLGQELTYDKVLEVLGAVDTEVFGRMLRLILKQDVAGLIAGLEELVIKGREPGQFVTDFTWYLRNLLLLKSSDNMEDVLDISSENLVLLKEEAAMVESGTLMRFIRVFSELSNQLRYGTQKRVLTEIALIKLCKPQMEENLDSLLARMNDLEKKLEQGIREAAAYGAAGGISRMGGAENGGYGMPGVPGNGGAYGVPGAIGSGTYGMPGVPGNGGAYGMPGAGGNGAPGAAPLPKAIPEDVQQVVKNWRSIIRDMPGSVRTFLKGARLSLGGDNTLLIVFEDEIAESYVNTEAHLAEISQAIGEKTGKDVEIQIRRNESARPFEESYVDIEKMINMELEIEDDEP